MFSTTFAYILLYFGLFVCAQGLNIDREFQLQNLVRERHTRSACPDQNHCRSKWGFCGKGPQFCGAGCRGGPCTGKGGSGGKKSGGSTSAGGSFHGDGTHYSVSAGFTACGTKHGDSELIAALNSVQFDPHTPNGNPNRNTMCNKRVHVKGPKGSVNVKIVDKCPSCKQSDLDLSEAAFKAVIGGVGVGRQKITWRWA